MKGFLYKNSYQCQQHLKMILISEMVKAQKKQMVKKYQYTKPYKIRDRSKDIGKDKPLKKSNRLKFPEKPQYYTLHTVQKLKPDHPFFNILNRDRAEVQKHYREVRMQVEQAAKNSELNVQSNMLETNSNNTPTPSKLLSGVYSSSGMKSYTDSSNYGISPFNRGFSVTSGPKIYKGSANGSFANSEQISVCITSQASDAASKQSVMSMVNYNLAQHNYSSRSDLSKRAST